MKNTFIKILFLAIATCYVQNSWSRIYRTETHTDRIKSLQVSVLDDWEAPAIINPKSGDFIEIKFDEMSHEYHYLAYRIIHCNADWTPSQLTAIEYLNGFQDLTISDYTFSFNTTMPYTHYKMVFPNDDVQFKVSGNYAIEVYDTEKPDVTLLSACFSITESALPIAAKVTTTTDIDFNKEHQQVSFNINCKDYRITSPQQELKVYVMQNSRRDNMVSLVQPTSILNNQFVYEHNRNLIFEAGNEYRRFEMTTTAYKGMGIDKLDFFSPYFHITLFKDLFRSHKSYIYDQDQDGKYLVRCVQGEDYDSESDYFFVHFSLESPEPLLGRVYILGEAFNNILDSRSEMEYNRETSTYEKTVIMKQGAYNDMYVLKTSDKSSRGSTAVTEGNYFQTENEYLILVYHRPIGGRYDRLVGVKNLRIEN